MSVGTGRRALGLVAAAALAAAGSAARATDAGDAAPPLDVTRWVESAPADVADRMRVVGLVAAGSATAAADVGSLEAAFREFSGRGVRFVTVLSGAPEETRVLTLGRQRGVALALDRDGRTRAAFGLAAEPGASRAFVVAADGRVAWSGAPGDDLRAVLAAATARPGGTSIELAARTPWAAASKRHAELAGAACFGLRVRGREALARSGDARALASLVAAYDRPEEPKEFVRASIVTMAAEFLSDPSHDAAWTVWTARHREDSDAWLWYRAAWASAAFDRGRRARAGMEEKDPFVAAASLRAFENAPAGAALVAAATTLGGLPPKGPARRLLVEAAAHVVAAKAAAPDADPGLVETCAETLVELLDDAQTPPRTKALAVACLRRVLGSAEERAEVGPWRTELAMWRLRRKAADGAPAAEGHSYFFGLPVRGERVAFVIDASTSMLEPVDGETLRKRREVVTGARQAAGAGPSIDWQRVRDRFDLAREALRVSLEALPERTRFAVVLFGDGAATAAATPSLVPATPANVKAVLAELESTAKRAAASHALLGDTNLHGALRVAFSLDVARKPDPRFPSARLLDEGCDAIYVLSDGQPNQDDFMATDRRDSEDGTREPGDGARVADLPTLSQPGPYWTLRGTRGVYSPPELVRSTPSYLVEDVARLNLFRDAAIHCVALSTADLQLLAALARLGGGEVVKFD